MCVLILTVYVCTYLLSELSGDFLWHKVISIHKNIGYISIYIRNGSYQGFKFFLN